MPPLAAAARFFLANSSHVSNSPYDHFDFHESAPPARTAVDEFGLHQTSVWAYSRAAVRRQAQAPACAMSCLDELPTGAALACKST